MPATVTIAIVVASLLLMVSGVVLFTMGTRGRWTRCEPSCAKCRHRVGSHEIVASARCPECGLVFTTSGAVRFFARRRRIGWMVLGPCTLVLGLGAAMAGALAEANMRRIVPPQTRTTAELISALSGMVAFMELQELESRALAGALTDEELEAVVRALIQIREPQDQRRLNQTSKRLLVIARGQGVLTDELALELLDSWYPAEALVAPPPVVRQGSTVVIRAANWDRMPPLTVSLVADDFAIGEQKVKPRDMASQVPGGERNLDLGAIVTFSEEPGEYRFTARVIRRLRFGAAIGEDSDPDTPRRLDFTDERTVSLPLRVIGRDDPTFLEVVTDPARAAEVRAAHTVRAAAIDRNPTSDTCVISIDLVPTGVDRLLLSFDVIVLVDDREVNLGWFTVERQGSAVGSTRSLSSASISPCPDPIPERVTILLRPQPKHAENSNSRLPAWGLEIEIADVPVRSNVRDGSARP
ncbi:MAG: hypothetical protein KF724_10160 [Phycisphaeraceae bacterium]|nr:hypothetical protein [Phycisphaeraceae bacterium]